MASEQVPIQRETLDADVLIVGAGPAGLACALHLANLIEKHAAEGKSPQLSAENIYVLEKGREIGAHQLSGAIMDPRSSRARSGLREIRAARYSGDRRRSVLLHAI
jgi:glycine/D-amino acid oxidase-like deaminating enzyme